MRQREHKYRGIEPKPEKEGDVFQWRNLFGLRTEKGIGMGNILNISCICCPLFISILLSRVGHLMVFEIIAIACN